MVKPNLLVTFDPMHDKSAEAEIESILKEIDKGKILKIDEGLAELSVKDAKKAVKAIADADSSKFQYTFYWWPVDEWCKPGIKDMQACIKKLGKGIKQKEKWKLDLSKRKTAKKYPGDIIIKLTKDIDQPNVDLKNPDKIIKVEITGNKAAVSVLSKDELVKKT